MVVIFMNVEIKNIEVEVDGKTILKDFSCEIKQGEIHVLMGPNGVGKSTLTKVLMGDKNYKVISGDILVDNKSILNLTPDERARMGIFLSFQNPIEIEGVTNSEFLKEVIRNRDEEFSFYSFVKELNQASLDLNLDSSMLHRALNKDFSGGEKKKNEILQMKILKPKLILLDELDSGLDVDSLVTVCKNVMDYKLENPDTSILLVTHYKRILELIVPDFVHVLVDGKIVKSGDMSLATKIDEEGYKIIKDRASELDKGMMV